MRGKWFFIETFCNLLEEICSAAADLALISGLSDAKTTIQLP